MIKHNSPLRLTADQIEASMEEAKLIFERREACRAHQLQEARQKEFLEMEIKENKELCREDPTLNRFCQLRIKDHSDFDYQFRHRDHYGDSIDPTDHQCRDRLQWVAEKLNAKTLDGVPCMFANWFEYDEYASIVALSRWRKSDSFCACGRPMPFRKNKRFNCGETLFCPLCNWRKILKDRIRVFGKDSGTFEKADRWFFITLSFTTVPEGERIASWVTERTFDRSRAHERQSLYSEGYAKRPVSMEEGPGYDVEVMFRVCRRALCFLRPRARRQRIVDGYDYRQELAIDYDPNRCLPHIHAVANDVTGRLDEGEVADVLFEVMKRELDEAKCGGYENADSDGMIEITDRRFHHRHLQPSIKVLRIDSAESLERILKYIHKPIDIVTPYISVIKDAESLNAAARYHALERLNASVNNIRGEIAEAYNCTRSARPVGNMRFDRNCIGELPEYIIARNERGREKKRLARARKAARAT